MRSDIDVHILVAGLEKPVGPHLRHAGATAVDVEQYPAAWPAREVARLGRVPAADLPLGRVALEQAVEGRQRRWLCRWIHAVPLEPDAAPVFSPDEIGLLLPAIVRQAVDEALPACATALLADRAAKDGAPAYTPQARAYLWDRAARAVLEVRCRAAGDVTTGEKWLPARARRLGLARPAPGCPADGGAGLVAELGFTVPGVFDAVCLRPGAGARRAEIAGRAFLVNRHDRLFTEWSDVDGTLARALAEHPAERLLDAVRRAHADLVADPAAVRRGLEP
jgi:hypothetical protein